MTFSSFPLIRKLPEKQKREMFFIELIIIFEKSPNTRKMRIAFSGKPTPWSAEGWRDFSKENRGLTAPALILRIGTDYSLKFSSGKVFHR
jgi:hypothetical protein